MRIGTSENCNVFNEMLAVARLKHAFVAVAVTGIVPSVIEIAWADNFRSVEANRGATHAPRAILIAVEYHELVLRRHFAILEALHELLRRTRSANELHGAEDRKHLGAARRARRQQTPNSD